MKSQSSFILYGKEKHDLPPGKAPVTKEKPDTIEDRLNEQGIALQGDYNLILWNDNVTGDPDELLDMKTALNRRGIEATIEFAG